MAGYKRQIIRLYCGSDRPPQEMQAEVHGLLAIFKIQYGWNITHVDSGIRVLNVIGNKELCLRVLTVLEQADWSGGSWGENPRSDSIRQAMAKVAEILYGKSRTPGNIRANNLQKRA